MKVHHKNMQQISKDMEQWVQSNLSNIGVYECCYARYDIKNKTCMSMPTFYNWYREYMEKEFDLAISSRLKTGINYWNMSESLYRRYQSFLKPLNIERAYKFDLVLKNDDGFEMLTVGCNRRLSLSDHTTIHRAINNLSSCARYIMENKPEVILEFRDAEGAMLRYQADTSLISRLN